MTLFDFYVSLRKHLLDQISGVENANTNLYWDDTTPNSTTKRQLVALLDKYTLLSNKFGVFVVTRYSRCAIEWHVNFPTENRYGISIDYKDPRFVWNGDQLFQGERLSICPCSTDNKLCSNQVIDDLIYDTESNHLECERIFLILQDIASSIVKSDSNMRRSGIREHLLRAVLRINDSLLPQPIEEYISEVQRKNK
ncbi:MAG: hypothetical protein JWM78_958 [Verrucomicrobiaceae bacterium]|nr:hypothetical protein [Verrucomicrobiaceae bacterium]